MTYRELLLQAELKLDHNDITLGEFEQMIAPLNREVDVLDKIRAEIEKERVEIHTIAFKGEYNNLFDDGRHNGLLKALEIIDKCRNEVNDGHMD